MAERSSSPRPPHPGDADALRRVAVHDIEPFARNPRHSRNVEYDRIKQSIRAHGLEQPLIVTCRPADARYVVGAGGNTRLEILRALYVETGDERFATAECVVRPWQSEAHVLLAHLRENELRGSLCFIDRARAVLELKALFEAEAQPPMRLSQRQLAVKLTQAGYAVSQGLVSHMVYAVEVLLPLLPEACATGLGRPQVERLRALERAATAVWQAHRLGAADAFATTFKSLCQRYDGPDWSLDAFRGALELELADAADVSIHSVRVMLEQALRVSATTHAGVDEAESAAAVADDATAPAPRTAAEPLRTTIAVGVAEGPPESPTAADAQHHATNETAEPLDSDDLATLRTYAAQLAVRLAGRYGLAAVVAATPAQGTGFAVLDAPPGELTESLDEETLSQVSMLWWHLAACAELTVAPVDAVVHALPETSVLRTALLNHDAELLFQRVWTLDPGQVGDRLWRQLPEADWQDLLTLMATYRRLHAVAASTNTNLWE